MRSQAVILPAIVVRIVLRRAVMAASNVAINLFIEFVMERTFGDHGPDCTWLETASFMDIHPWRIGLWALEGAVGGHSAALAAVFGGADAAISYLLTTGSGQFSLDAFFLKVIEGALIGAGASHLSTVVLDSKTAKKFFARVEARTGSTIAELENELFPLWIPFLRDFRRVGAWEALASFPYLRKNLGALDAKILPKGQRPDPNSYLDGGYINTHLNQFYGEAQASRIVLKDSHLQYGVGKPDVGKTEFVSLKSDMDNLLNQANGDISIVANGLAVPVDQLQGGLVRIDFNISNSGNQVFMPTGNEFGANLQWLPGGKLPDGKSEAIVKTEGMVEGIDYFVEDLIF